MSTQELEGEVTDRRVHLSSADQVALSRAVVRLEVGNFVVRLADRAGEPINSVLRALPRAAHDKLQAAVRHALNQCVKVAITSLDKEPPAEHSDLSSKLIAGITGGVSGFAGLAALPIELPITTTNILRAIAAIARAEGENLASRDTQMACLQVFALGHKSGSGIAVETSYYALRSQIAKATGDAVSYLLGRGASEEAAPALTRLVTEIGGRYCAVAADRAAASAVPVFGALGGATINWIFADYFQEVAHGHFTMRRLERTYGEEPIRDIYREVARRLAESSRKRQVARASLFG